MKQSTKEVLASVDFPVVIAKANGDVRVRAFTCKDSGQTVVANYMTSPFSPITGGKLAPVDKKVLTITEAELKTFESLGTCPSCGSELVAHKTLANALVGNEIHCIVCGEGLEVDETDPSSYWDALSQETEKVEEAPADLITTMDEVTAEGEEILEPTEEAEELITTQEPVEAEMDETPLEAPEVTEELITTQEPVEAETEEEAEEISEEVPTEETEEPAEEVEASEDTILEVEPEAEEIVEEAPVEEVVEEEPAEAPVQAEGDEVVDETVVEEEIVPEMTEEAPVEEEIVEAPAEEEVIEGESTEESFEPTETPDEEMPVAEEETPAEILDETKDEEVRIDMLARVQAGLNSKKVEVIASGKSTLHYVMVSNKPVATLHRSRACAEVQDIFDNLPLLEKSLTASIAKEGLTKSTASAFGLVPMILKVKASEVVEKAVEDQLTTMQAQEDAERVEYEEAYEQSLGMAAVGMNRNAFADCKNALAEEIVDKFEEIGIDDAREIVESCFLNKGEEYLRQILVKASEFKEKSAEVRNEIAASLAGTNFQSAGLNLSHKVQASAKSEEDSNFEENVNKYRSLF